MKPIYKRSYDFGIRKDFVFGPITFDMGRNKKHKSLIEKYPHLYPDQHYAVAEARIGWWKWFQLHCQVNNEGSIITYFSILGRWGLSFWGQERIRVDEPGYHTGNFWWRPTFWRMREP